MAEAKGRQGALDLLLGGGGSDNPRRPTVSNSTVHGKNYRLDSTVPLGEITYG